MPRFAAIPGRRAEGQMLVLFAISLVALILFAGLVVDGGNAFLNRRDGQNASDVGAMAGTKRLADYYVKPQPFIPGDNGNNAWSAINKRMTENGCTSATNCSWTARYVGPRTGATFVDLGEVRSSDSAPPGAVSGQKALGVKVDVTKMPRTFFLGVIGQGSWTIQTTATGITGQPSGAPANQLLPIALMGPFALGALDEGRIVPLTSGKDGPGQFGWISWTGSNDPNALAASLCTPNNPAFTLPHQYSGDPGKSNSNDVRDCLSQWEGSQTPVLIPIVEPVGPDDGCMTGGQGNGFSYCIVGIAAFVITSHAQPAVDQVNGRFVGTIPYSTGATVPAGVTTPPTLGSSLYLIGLAQ